VPVSFAYARRKLIYSFPENVKNEIISAYSDALKVTWIVAAAIAGVCLVLTLFEKEIPLRESLRTEFAIKEPKKGKDGEAAKPNTRQKKSLVEMKVGSEVAKK
jgi:hypothetical protein